MESLEGSKVDSIITIEAAFGLRTYRMDDLSMVFQVMQGTLVDTCPLSVVSSLQSGQTNQYEIDVSQVSMQHTCWLIRRIAMSFLCVNSSKADSISDTWVSSACVSADNLLHKFRTRTTIVHNQKVLFLVLIHVPHSCQKQTRY